MRPTAMIALLAAAACTRAPAGPIVWGTDEEAAYARARSEGRPVLVEFWAEWCEPCRDMDEKTFSDERVRAAVRDGFVPLRVDASEPEGHVAALEMRFGVHQLPSIGAARADGSPIDSLRIEGFQPPDRLLEALDRVR